MSSLKQAVADLLSSCCRMNEYQAAFSTRPKIPRTPDSGSRPMSRGSVGDGPTPQPKYSDSLPTPRPGSGSGHHSSLIGSLEMLVFTQLEILGSYSDAMILNGVLVFCRLRESDTSLPYQQTPSKLWKCQDPIQTSLNLWTKLLDRHFFTKSQFQVGKRRLFCNTPELVCDSFLL